MAKNNVQSVSYLLCTQVLKPQIIHKPQNQSWHKFTENKTYTNIGHKIFEHAGIVDHSVDLSISDLKKV